MIDTFWESPGSGVEAVEISGISLQQESRDLEICSSMFSRSLYRPEWHFTALRQVWQVGVLDWLQTAEQHAEWAR